MYKQLVVYKDETNRKSLSINLTCSFSFSSVSREVKRHIIFIKNADFSKKMPRQYSVLKIFLNHSANFQVFGIILSPNKVRRVEGGSFNTPLPINQEQKQDQNDKVEIGSRFSWSYDQILSGNKIWKLELAIN